MVGPLSARELIKRLGTFLADLTADRPPARIHSEILLQLQETWQEPDPQLSGIYFDEKDFSSVWTAVRNGASLPANSWDTVILPVVVFFSGRESLKSNLETAIHLWSKARSALSDVLESSAEPESVPFHNLSEQNVDTLSLPRAVPTVPERPTSPAPRRRSRPRWLVATAASLALVAAAIAVVIYSDHSKDPFTGSLPRDLATEGPLTTAPSQDLPVAPEATPTAIPNLPIRSPSPGVVPPSAPRGLTMISKTATTVTLSWQPPLAEGTGGLSHYRVFTGMTSSPNLTGTTYTVTGLTPKTGYVFRVVAYNLAGAPSPASNAVAAATSPIGPAPNIRTNPDPLRYAEHFRIEGANWPCTAPGKVQIYLSNRLIAEPLTDDRGQFSQDISVILDLPLGAKILIIDGSGEYFLETRDQPESIRVVLLSNQPQCGSAPPQTIPVVFS